jgi:hypothetical protein
MERRTPKTETELLALVNAGIERLPECTGLVIKRITPVYKGPAEPNWDIDFDAQDMKIGGMCKHAILTVKFDLQRKHYLSSD